MNGNSYDIYEKVKFEIIVLGLTQTGGNGRRKCKAFSLQSKFGFRVWETKFGRVDRKIALLRTERPWKYGYFSDTVEVNPNPIRRAVARQQRHHLHS